MIGSLQSLRFVFAAMIFLHHFDVDGSGLFEAGGDCGVSFFLMLSGFVMTKGYGDLVGNKTFDYRTYIKRRLVRIYPLHALCLLGAFVLYRGGLGPMLSSALLIQSWIPERDYYFSGNAVAWCLSVLLFCYAIFPFLLNVLKQGFKSRLYVFGVAVVAVVVAIWFVPERLEHALFYISPVFRIVDFMAGILLYFLYAELEAKGFGDKVRLMSFGVKSICELSIIGILVAAILMHGSMPPSIGYAICWWLPIAVVIIAFALFDKSGGMFSSVLACRFFLSLGEISFSFYLIHVVVMGYLDILLVKSQVEIFWAVQLLVYFIITLSLSYVVYWLYEKPITAFLLKRLC